MKKILILSAIIISALQGFAQIKVKDLPTTTTGSTNDFIIKDDAAGIAGSTKKINVGNFISAYSLQTALIFSTPLVNTSGTISITNSVPGGLTGKTSFTAYAVICGGTTSTGALQSVSGLGTSGQVLTSAGAGSLPTWTTAGTQWTTSSNDIYFNSTLGNISGGQVGVGGIPAASLALFQVLDTNVTTPNNAISTYNPNTNAYIFQVSSKGRVTIKDGTQGTGKFLTSDASGVASWTSSLPTTSTFSTVLTNGSNGGSIAITNLGNVTNANANFSNVMTNSSPGYWQSEASDLNDVNAEGYFTTDVSDTTNPYTLIFSNRKALTVTRDRYTQFRLGYNSAEVSCNPVNQTFAGLTYTASTATVVSANQTATSILHRAANDTRYLGQNALTNTYVGFGAGGVLSGSSNLTFSNSTSKVLAITNTVTTGVGVVSISNGTVSGGLAVFGSSFAGTILGTQMPAANACAIQAGTSDGLLALGGLPISLSTGILSTDRHYRFDNTGLRIATQASSSVTATATLEVNGSLKFVTGNQGTNKILQSDASGNADWATPASQTVSLTSQVTGILPIANGGTNNSVGAATLSAITNDNSTNAVMYPAWVTTASGNQAIKTASTGLTFNPSIPGIGIGCAPGSIYRVQTNELHPLDISTSLDTNFILAIANTNSLSVAQASFRTMNDEHAVFDFTMNGSGLTPIGISTAGVANLYTNNTHGGIAIMAADASAGAITFATGGTALKAKLDKDGNFGLGHVPAFFMDVYKSTDAAIISNIENPSTGTSAQCLFQATNNGGKVTEMGTYGTNKGAVGAIASGDGFLYSNGVNLTLMAGASSGAIKFATNTTTERMRITGNGGISFGSSGTAYGSSGQILQSNGDAAPTWITAPTITTGTYTPTCSAITNCDAVSISSGAVFYYTSTTYSGGPTVINVDGWLSIDGTTTMLSTEVDITKPVASTFTTAFDVSGSLNPSTDGGAGQVFAETSGSYRARVLFAGQASTSAVNNAIHFSYTVK
jgi:hypothetical protein